MIESRWWVLASLLVGCTRLPIGPDPAGGLDTVAAVTPAPAVTRAAPVPAPTATAPAPGADASSSAAFQRSYDDEAAGKLESSLAALDAVHATSGPAAYVVALRRGWLLYRLGKHDDAVLEYGNAAALAPDGVEARVGSLAPLAALRRWNDVESTAREVLARDPASYAATLRLAFALYSQARFADAEAAYRRLARLYPSDVEVKDGLGWSLLKLGRAGEASATFAEVLAIAPRNRLALDGARAAGAAGASAVAKP